MVISGFVTMRFPLNALRWLPAALLAGCTSTASAEVGQSQTALQYLRSALAIIATHPQTASLDWASIEGDALHAARDANSISDTHSIIRRVLDRIGDPHSELVTADALHSMKNGLSNRATGCLLDPETLCVMRVYSGSPADKSGIALGHHIVSVDGILLIGISSSLARDYSFYGALSSTRDATVVRVRNATGDIVEKHVDLAVVSTYLAPQGKMLPGGYAYLEIPYLTQVDKTVDFASECHRIISQLGKSNPCGWIIDLRRNEGGLIWPMLLGCGPLMGRELIGSMQTIDGYWDWRYSHGAVRVGGKEALRVPFPAQDMPDVPIVVLTSHRTASAAEGLAIALRGADHAIIAGEATRGETTTRRGHQLSDGSALMLTNGVMQDSRGRVFGSAVVPDVPCTVDWATFGTANDPGLLVATQWLAKHSRRASEK